MVIEDHQLSQYQSDHSPQTPHTCSSVFYVLVIAVCVMMAAVILCGLCII